MLIRNMLYLGSFGLVVTGASWTTANAVGMLFKTLDDKYFLYFTIYGSIAGGSASPDIYIQGVSFPFLQAICMESTSSGQYTTLAEANSDAAGHITGRLNAAGTDIIYNGLVQLSSKPTFYKD